MVKIKHIEGYEWLYSVDEWGRVFSHRRNRFIFTSEDSYGYIKVALWKNGKKKTVKVHRLVAKAFIPNPNSLPEINHINGDKSDNRACNLEWVSRRDNVIHAYRTGLVKRNRFNFKLNKEQVKQIRTMYKTNSYTMKELADMFNVSITNIYHILHNKIWKNVA